LAVLLGVASAHCHQAPARTRFDAGSGADATSVNDAFGSDAAEDRDAAPGATDAAQPDSDATISCDAARASDPVSVVTTRGTVRGKVASNVTAFLGIPYVAPPIGPLRFRPPEEHACWGDVLDATQFGSICPQYGAAGVFTGDEDCLTLNVWTPAIAARPGKPVMFFIHGGANLIGASNLPLSPGLNLYDGLSLAEREDAVVVTINYRLGAFGFLALPELTAESARHASGNYALLDQIAALQWVQNNIARFGGDPLRVMIFGESAGAMNTCMLLASPLAQGLFEAALIESGNCDAPPLAVREAQGSSMAKALGCGLASDVAACARSASPAAWVTATPIGASNLSLGWNALPYGPSVDGYVIAEPPIAAIRNGAIPVVIGTNADETELFLEPGTINTCLDYAIAVRTQFPALVDQLLAEYPCAAYPLARWALVDLTTDFLFTCPTRRIARVLAANPSRPVYRYLYRWTRADPAVSALRAFHSSELPLVFGTYDHPLYQAPSVEVALSARMQDAWGRLARTHDEGSDWARYAIPSDDAHVFDGTDSSTSGLNRAHCDFWDSVQ
jgi:para-nitrobenzyl esterase